MNFRITCLLVVTTAAALLAPTAATAQNGAEILNISLARWEARMQGVENYTMVARIAGVETTSYYEREMVDGRLTFQLRDVWATGVELPADAISEWEDPDPYAGFAEMADRARYEGTEIVDGHNTHVLAFDDLTGMPGMDAAPGQTDIDLRSGLIYIDADGYVIRRMVMEGVANHAGQPQEVTMEVLTEDYREVQGVDFPFRTVVRMTGFAPPGPAMDADEIESMIAMVEAQMAMLPPEDRGMMEAMVEQSRRMLAGEPMEMTTEVVDLRVNEGPPRVP